MDKKIPVNEVSQGMFISALDRPWTDTPFLLQGFLVETPEDVAELRRYCRHVYFDPARSVGERFEQALALERRAPEDAAEVRVIRRVRPDATAIAATGGRARGAPEAAHVPSGTGKTARDAARTSQAPARRHPGPRRPDPVGSARSAAEAGSGAAVDGDVVAMERVRSAVERERQGILDGGFVVGWLQSIVGRFRGERFKDDRHDARAEESRGWQPPPSVVIYEEAATLAEEMPRAEKTMERAQVALQEILSEVESKGTLRIENASEIVGELVDSMVRNPNALMWLAHLRRLDARAYSHSLESAVYMVAVGLQLGLDRGELANLSTAGLMLDVGKLRLPSELLDRPGKLTEAEFEVVKRHVQYGVDMVSSGGGVHPAVVEAVARHHEREDGSGYPDGLKGDEIGLYGRIAGIVDTYVAVTNPRTYAKTLSPHDGVRALYRWRERIFHEPLVEVFVHSIGVFPVGSMVELASGEVAIVVAHNRVRRLKPRVLLVTGPDKLPLSRPTPLDLLYAPAGPGGNELTIVRSLPQGAFGIDAREYYVQ